MPLRKGGVLATGNKEITRISSLVRLSEGVLHLIFSIVPFSVIKKLGFKFILPKILAYSIALGERFFTICSSNFLLIHDSILLKLVVESQPSKIGN